MESVTSQALIIFFQRLGEQFPHPAKLYLLGGSALILMGSPRATLDVDYTVELDEQYRAEFDAVLSNLAAELDLDLERVPIAEFIPLPPQANQRCKFLGRYSGLEVFIFDLYSIALSKIARGFEADFEDVEFMLRKGWIEIERLKKFYKLILPNVSKADIDAREFQRYYDELLRRIKMG